MFSWLTSTFLGKLISTFFLSMVPVIELRGGLPYGIALGLDYALFESMGSQLVEVQTTQE